jgi:membrane associated rhomboid family serine protease
MRPSFGSSFRSSGETPAVYCLLVLMGVVLLADLYLHSALSFLLAWHVAWSWFPSLEYWRAITFPFAHLTDFNLFLMDAIVLYFFGGALERAWGSTRFLFFFFISGLLAGGIILALAPWFHGGIFVGMVGSWIAITIAYAALAPDATVLLFFVLPISARILALVSIGIELFFRNVAYGGPVPASIAIVGLGVFAYFFTRGGFTLRFGPRGGPTMRERIERWQQRRRMRQWQRRVSSAQRPEDLFKDKK